MLGAQQIQLDHQQVVIGGGMESMSNAPFYLPRDGPSYGNFQAIDSILRDGLTDAYNGDHMGQCGEKTSREFKISREEQDDFAIRSYKLAAESWDVSLSLNLIHFLFPDRSLRQRSCAHNFEIQKRRRGCGKG
jgi:acetyl-CoA C-acetyltransferase